MAGRYLLDTNVLIAFLQGESGVAESVNAADEIYMSCIAVGELRYGARKSGRMAENLARVEALVSDVVVLGCDVETARQYGDIKSRLHTRGRPIPDNDVWIAATSVQHELVLVTRDARFRDIPELELATW